MKRRFVVTVNGLTKDQERSFIEHIRELGLAWWHWIDNFWLLVDRHDKTNVTELRDALKRFRGPSDAWFLKFPEDVTWAGLGPKTEDSDMFKWIRSTWKGSA